MEMASEMEIAVPFLRFVGPLHFLRDFLLALENGFLDDNFDYS